MKPFYALKLSLLLAVLCGWSVAGFSQTVFSYNGTSAVQTFVCPQGVSAMSVDMYGGTGGNAGPSSASVPGGGGRVQCILAVTPGMTYWMYAGSAGGNGTTTAPGAAGLSGGQVSSGNAIISGGVGGFNTSTPEGGGGGGAASDIRVGGTTLASRLVVAAGGGGAGYGTGSVNAEVGGNGGGLTGVPGQYNFTAGLGGQAGTPVAGGAGSTEGSPNPNGAAGAFGLGGAASTWSQAGGGGGGGYYGGGGGYASGGGGGSSYANPSFASGVTHTQGYNVSGNGQITIVYGSLTSTATSVAFGNVVVGSSSALQAFTVNGSNLVAALTPSVTVTAPAGFQVSWTGAPGTWATTIAQSYTMPTITGLTIYVEFVPTAYSAYTGNVLVSAGGAFMNMPVTGTGVFPCTGTPGVGTATISPTSGPGGTSFTMGVPPILGLGGISYQWQMWSFTASGFVNIPGAITPTYTFSAPATNFNNSWFQCVVSCSYSGLSATSNMVEAVSTSATSSTPCSGTLLFIPGGTSSAFASSNSGCSPGYSSTLYLGTTLTDPSYVYNWEVSTTGPTTGFTQIAGATTPFYTYPVSGTVWIRDSISCYANGSGSGVYVFTGAQKLTYNTTPVVTGPSMVCTGTASQYNASLSGGTWVSNNIGLLSIGITNGIATGVNPGATSVVYTMPSGCSATANVTVNEGAMPVVGGSTVCPGTTTALTDPTPFGTWSSTITAAATVNATSGVVTGVAAGTSSIVYTLPNGCSVNEQMVVNPLPAAITGSSSVCVGQGDILSDATSGGTWSSSDPFQAAVGSTSGIATGVAAGLPAIYYTLPTGCRSALNLRVNANPAAITGNTSVCTSSTTTLADGFGTWTSGNVYIASVSSTSGVVTGVTAGTAIITFYSGFSGCFATASVTVNPMPTVVNVTEPTGGGFCPDGPGVHLGVDASYSDIEYYLYYGSGKVDSLLGGGSSLDFGLYTALGTYSVSATNIATGCATNMAGSATVYNYPLPTPDSVSGGGSYCAGGNGVDVYMQGSQIGVNYQLYITGVASGLPFPGTGAMIDLGMKTAGGFYTVVGTNATTTCVNNMPGGAGVTILPVPVIDTIGGGGAYCLGGTGVDVHLNNSSLGIFYKLYNDTTLVNTIYSVGGPIDFGMQTGVGTYTIMALNNLTSCTSWMSGTATVSIDSLPALYATTSGGNYCYGGTGSHIGVAYGVAGTNYLLYKGSTLVNTVAGANSGVDFGLETAGTYKVVGKFASTGCLDTMLGTVTIGTDSLPTQFNVTGTAAYCYGGSGVPVALAGSQAGGNFKYQLYLNGSTHGGPVTGTGSGLTFGPETGSGVYKVIATNITTNCSSMMSDSAVVTVEPQPNLYILSGGGNYCTGGAGVPFTLSGGQPGIRYHLVVSGDTVSSMIGTGSINFGLQTIAGIYSAYAINTATGCWLQMSGDPAVATLPLPAAYPVSGGGAECAGGSGFPVNLTTSTIGVNYQLYNSGLTGPVLNGDGGGITFGNQTVAGTYKVVATQVSTGCTDTMSGSAVIAFYALPGRYTITGGGAFCSGGSGVPLSLTSSDAGAVYQLFNGSTPSGPAVTSAGGTVNFGDRSTSGGYWATATSVHGCVDTMIGSATVVANPSPTVYNVSGGGSFCANDTGVHIFLNGSNTYVNYQVFRNGSIPMGSFWAGTGFPLDLGLDSAGGIYTVIATNVNNGCISDMTGSATLTVLPLVTPSVTVTTAHDTICAGVTTVFTAMPVNGGADPMYLWKVGGTVRGSGPTLSYVPANGDTVWVFLTSDAMCAAPATVSNSMIVRVTPNQLPVVSISASNTTVCPGTSVTFTSSTSYGGSAPTFQWRVNSMAVGSSTPTYTYVPGNNDAVDVAMTSNYQCVSSDYVLSNPVVMTVDVPVVPVFAITGNTAVEHLQNLTLTAVVGNVPPSELTYQWKVNGNVVAGANTAIFSSSSLNNGDVVCADIFSTNECGVSASAEECVTAAVGANLAVGQVSGEVNLQVAPNPNKGDFVIKGTISNVADQQVTVEVTNMVGQVVYSGPISVANGTVDQHIQLGSDIANGMYLLSVHAGSESHVFHFVVEQ